MTSLLSDNRDVMNALLRAISDPGSITPRAPRESLPNWQRRAVVEFAAPYIAAAGREQNVNWEAAQALSQWLDSEVSPEYQQQPLAQDWARISKVAEETGEAIEAFIGATGQNPRKGQTHSMDDVTDELADVALTGIYALIHFAGPERAREVLTARQRRHNERVGLPFADLLRDPTTGGES